MCIDRLGIHDARQFDIQRFCCRCQVRTRTIQSIEFTGNNCLQAYIDNFTIAFTVDTRPVYVPKGMDIGLVGKLLRVCTTSGQFTLWHDHCRHLNTFIVTTFRIYSVIGWDVIQCHFGPD